LSANWSYAVTKIHFAGLCEQFQILEPVQLRHLDIQKKELRFVLCNLLYGVEAVAALCCTRMRIGRKVLANYHARKVFIVDNIALIPLIQDSSALEIQ